MSTRLFVANKLMLCVIIGSAIEKKEKFIQRSN